MAEHGVFTPGGTDTAAYTDGAYRLAALQENHTLLLHTENWRSPLQLVLSH